MKLIDFVWTFPNIKGIESMTVFNGMEGVTGVSGEVMKMGLGVLPLLRELLKPDGGNGAGEGKRSTKRTAAPTE